MNIGRPVEEASRAPRSPDLDEVRRVVLRGLTGRPARVFLFGSWVRGQACRVSDIDVAILPERPLPAGLLTDIQDALENSRSLYPVDLVDLSATSGAFRDRVLAEGLEWPRNGAGEMGSERLPQDRLPERLDVARRALATLRGALREEATALHRDASMLRFKYTYEAVWKAAHLFLRIAENVESASPTAVIRACFQAALLDDARARIALDIARDRNLTAHTYNEELAELIYSRLAVYAGLMESWLAAIAERSAPIGF